MKKQVKPVRKKIKMICLEVIPIDKKNKNRRKNSDKDIEVNHWKKNKKYLKTIFIWIQINKLLIIKVMIFWKCKINIKNQK